MGRRSGATTVGDFAGDLLQYLADFDFIKKIRVQNEAEDMARNILLKRAKGDAALVDDWDMKQADDQFMYDFTPLDMSTEARLQRAASDRFEGPYIHGTDEYLQTITDGGFFGSKNPAVSETYQYGMEGQLVPFLVRMPDDVVDIDNYGRTFNRINPFALDKTSGKTLDEVMSRDGKGGLLDTVDPFSGYSATLNVDPSEVAHMSKKAQDDFDFFETTFDLGSPTERQMINVGFPTTTDDILDMMPSANKSVVKIDNIVDIGGNQPKDKARQIERRKPSENNIVRGGANVRSPFARFDPEFRHLRNLSASVVPASVGMAQLLQKPDVTKEEIEEYLSGAGL